MQPCLPACTSRSAPAPLASNCTKNWGSTPAAISNCLDVAEETDTQVAIHTDTLNESGFVEDTVAAFKGRTIHTFHTEGAGGGHAPDILKVVGEANVLPSSTNPTRPYTINTLDEHVDMLMVCHHLDAGIAEDLAFAESRIRKETIAAEDILHDIGAISMFSSDSQAMGRVGEVILRTWQTAHKMKQQRGALTGDGARNDNFRVKRYIAKYTINPAIAHGISHEVGSIEVGKWADLVIWKPAFFGVKPFCILKAAASPWRPWATRTRRFPRPARALPPHVCQLWRGHRQDLADLCLAGRTGGRHRRAVWPGQAAVGREGHPRRAKAAHGLQRPGATHGGGRPDLCRARRWATADVRARTQPAHGAALLPVLSAHAPGAVLWALNHASQSPLSITGAACTVAGKAS